MSGPETANGHRRVLYVIACGSPLARHVGRLVDLAQRLPELTAAEVLQLNIVAKPGVLALAPAPKGLF